MFQNILCAIMLFLSCVSVSANALHLNPTQPTVARNMATFGTTTIPIGYYEYCKRYQERCERSSDSAFVELTEDRWRALVSINNGVNAAVAPQTDREIFGVEERWEYPDTVGDCEDYALLKRKRLNELGFPLGALLMTVGKDSRGGGHAVLTVVTDLGDFVLDNIEQKVLLWQDAEIYFLKRQSEANPNTWVSLVAG